MVAYRRASRLYSRAALLDAAFAVTEVSKLSKVVREVDRELASSFAKTVETDATRPVAVISRNRTILSDPPSLQT